jgi:hypothetical protein
MNGTTAQVSVYFFREALVRHALHAPQSEWLDEKTCYHDSVENRTEPKTARQWLRYIVVSIIALGLVAWMLRLYVL